MDDLEYESPSVKTSVDCLSRLYMLLKRDLESQSGAMQLVDENESEMLSTVLDVGRYLGGACWSQMLLLR